MFYTCIPEKVALIILFQSLYSNITYVGCFSSFTYELLTTLVQAAVCKVFGKRITIAVVCKAFGMKLLIRIWLKLEGSR